MPDHALNIRQCAQTGGRASQSTPQPQPARTGADSLGIRVLCVDDHALLVEGLKAQFGIDGHIGVVGWLPSAETLLEEIERVKPDVVLLDIEMPGPDVFETADRMRHKYPQLRFAFLSAHLRDGYLAAAYKSGAWGYFAKGDRPEDIAAGIMELARCTSGAFIMGPKVRQRCAQPSASSPALRSSMLHRPPPQPSPATTPLQSLTSREMEILRLIGKGLSRVEIASELSRSVKTIDGHQDRLMKKLGVHSRADLIRCAIREGIAEA